MNNRIKSYVKNMVQMGMNQAITSINFSHADLVNMGLDEDFKGEMYIAEKQIVDNINTLSICDTAAIIDKAGAEFIKQNLMDHAIMREANDKLSKSNHKLVLVLGCPSLG